METKVFISFALVFVLVATVFFVPSECSRNPNTVGIEEGATDPVQFSRLDAVSLTNPRVARYFLGYPMGGFSGSSASASASASAGGMGYGGGYPMMYGK